MKAIIYVRVSRSDMNYDRQVSDLKAVAAFKQWQVVNVISEKISGAKADRLGIKELLHEASKGTMDKILVTEVSRLGRSTLQVLQTIEQLTAFGISVYFHNFSIETLLPNGKKNPMVAMMLTILAEFATMERENLIDRTKSGIQHARKNGRILGRPVGSRKLVSELYEQYRPAIKLLNQGLSIRKVAKLCDLSVNTILKVKQSLQVA